MHCQKCIPKVYILVISLGSGKAALPWCLETSGHRVGSALPSQNASWIRLISTFSSCSGVTPLVAMRKLVCS